MGEKCGVRRVGEKYLSKGLKRSGSCMCRESGNREE